MTSIIIPNYNGEKNLAKNIPHLLKVLDQEKNVEIIIVDDASKDNSINYINNIIKENPRFKIVLIENEKNMGFSPTVNKGVSQSRGDIIVLLNTDVRPHEDFLKVSLEDIKNNDVFAVGFLDESIEDGKAVLRGRGIGSWQKGFLIHKAGDLEKNNSLWASGGSSMFKRELWEKLGGFDELYTPFYWEDIDLSYRALRSGYKVLFEKKSVVVHEHEEGSIKSAYSKNQIKKIAYRNQFIFVWKNASLPLLISNILWLPYHGIKSLISGDLLFFMGFLQALRVAPKILKKRQEVQKMFKKSDLDVQILE